MQINPCFQKAIQVRSPGWMQFAQPGVASRLPGGLFPAFWLVGCWWAEIGYIESKALVWSWQPLLVL
jgi:hypothetical protein